MGTTLRPDICVIGAGSGGLSVAAAAAAFGVDIVLIERHRMGGDCLNYGCVPSKALIAAAKAAHTIRTEAGHFGLATSEPQIDFAAVNRHVKGVIASITPHDSVERYRAMGVTVIEADARFVDERTVEAGDTTIRARRFVIATGSRAAVPPIDGLQDVDYLTNETLFDLTERPDHLIIVGGGPIGMEMAQAHRRLGSAVTVLEGAKVFGKDDPELSQIVVRRLQDEGVVIHEGAKVTSVAKTDGAGVRVLFKTEAGEAEAAETHVEGSHLLLAVGRRPNVDTLNLEAAKVGFDKSGLDLDDGLRSRTNRRVYGVGDVAGRLQFTHVAGFHASQVIRSILFRLPAKPDPSIVPWVTFTDPPLAHAGLTETQARQTYGDHISIRRWPFTENDRAQTERRTEGVLKMIISKGRIVGVTIAGAHADEMIVTWALAIERRMKASDVTGFVPPYPVIGEVGKRAATDHFTAMAQKGWARSLVGTLSRFG